MDFTLTEEQIAIRDTCREFAEQEIKPLAEELDATGRFPYDLIRKMGELGLLGLPFPEEYGGAGADFLSYCIAIEEISRGDVSIGITMEAHTSLGASPFYLFGSKEQKEHFLPPLARGEQLWAFGLTEPAETVMIEEIQRDHIRREILHVDLHLISLTEAIEVSVPVILTGTPEGVTSGGGVLEQHRREVEVRCLPTQIPDSFTVDVSGLRVGASMHVRDLNVPEGIEILTLPEEVLAAVVAPAVEEEAAAAPEAEAAAEPEVVGRAPAEGEAAPAEDGAKGAKAEAKPAKADAKPAKSEKKE